MIQINILQEAPVSFGAIPRTETAYRSSRSSSRIFMAAFLVVVLAIGGGIGFLMLAGVPSALAPFVPETLVTALGLEVPAPEAMSVAGSPDQPGNGNQNQAATNTMVQPAVPQSDAVEEIVKTVRPDLFYIKERKEYRELLPSERIQHQKKAIAHALTLFRSITPPTFGFTDLVFKNPDYFYVRGVASDNKSRQNFVDSLRTNSSDFVVAPQADSKRALEFIAYGRLHLESQGTTEKLALLTPSQVSTEVTALSELALKYQVRLRGLDKPKITNHGLYRRVQYSSQTFADFPSLQQFAVALRESNLRIGVLQFSIRPASDDGPAAVFDFVVYTAP